MKTSVGWTALPGGFSYFDCLSHDLALLKVDVPADAQPNTRHRADSVSFVEAAPIDRNSPEKTRGTLVNLFPSDTTESFCGPLAAFEVIIYGRI